MKQLLILGAGTAGTMVANRAVKTLPGDWRVTVVDPSDTHLYQPGLLFLPFGARDEDKMVRPRGRTLSKRVDWVVEAVQSIDAGNKTVLLQNGRKLDYDLLVVASGTDIRPDETEGLATHGWYRDAFDFYTLPGAQALRRRLESFKEGRLVLNVVEMPIKCPVAPLEFLFLADAYFTSRGIRDAVEIVYATPLDGAFTKKLASERLGYLLEQKGIEVVSEFSTGSVDPDKRRLVSWDEREVDYDLLVSIPTHMGADFVERSDLGDELNFIPTDKHSLAAKGLKDVFVLGDATDLPASKAGSVAHFQAELLVENLARAARGESLKDSFDGHANCFIETGHGKAMLIDFNYDNDPLPGSFPMPGVGPFSLLSESRTNHLGKLSFRWLYWNGLLPGKPLPVPPQFSLTGKHTDAAA